MIGFDEYAATTRLTDRLTQAEVPTLAIIDHHAPQGLLTPEFSDVRPVGAAATILTDYIRSGEVLELDVERDELPAGLRFDAAVAVSTMHHVKDAAGALEKVKAKYLDEFGKRDLHFFLGTTQQFHGFAPNNPIEGGGTEGRMRIVGANP